MAQYTFPFVTCSACDTYLIDVFITYNERLFGSIDHQPCSIQAGSLLDVRFELKPLGKKADYSIMAKLKPVQIIYDAVSEYIVECVCVCVGGGWVTIHVGVQCVLLSFYRLLF